jgi:hypothetical protein
MSKENKTLTIAILINETGCDQASDFAIQLYNGELVVDLGELKKGTKVECITFDFETGDLQVTDEEGEIQYEGKFGIVLL